MGPKFRWVKLTADPDYSCELKNGRSERLARIASSFAGTSNCSADHLAGEPGRSGTWLLRSHADHKKQCSAPRELVRQLPDLG
jgi:hypothetical protein